MLIRSQRVVIESRLPPDAVLAQLERHAHEWCESAPSPAARAAGALGWIVRAQNGRVVVTPRIAGQSYCLPVFAGEIRPTPTGSVLHGHLRVHWASRAFLLVWVCALGAVPLLTVMRPESRIGTGAIVVLLTAVAMTPFAASVLAAGPWRPDRASSLAGRATLEMMRDVARGEALRSGDITQGV